MKRLSLALALLTGFGLAQAASHEYMNDRNMPHDMAAHEMQTMHQGMGVVKAINEKSGKVQIAHQPIAALGWPAMTMWFGLDARHLRDIKVGDKVRFDMMQNADKQWVIHRIWMD